MMSSLDLILIRGAPGVGKTTIAKLSRESRPTGVVVDVDDVRRMVASETFTYGDNGDYRKSVTATCALVESFLVMGYTPIVVVDVFSGPILELFIASCPSRRVAVITLYAEDRVLARRMARRPNGYINPDVAIKVNRLMKPACESSDACDRHVVVEPCGCLRRNSTTGQAYRGRRSTVTRGRDCDGLSQQRWAAGDAERGPRHSPQGFANVVVAPLSKWPMLVLLSSSADSIA